MGKLPSSYPEVMVAFWHGRVGTHGSLGVWGRGVGTSKEEGVFGADSCRHLLIWAERGLQKLGKPPFVCQAAQSAAEQSRSGWVTGVQGSKPLRDEQPSRRMKCLELTPISARPVGVREGWDSVVHLPFFSRELASPNLLPFGTLTFAGESFSLQPLFCVSVGLM